MSFEGLRVLSLESRRAKEMEALIRRWNGDPFVAPSVQERAIDSQAEALAWAARLIAGEFELVLFTTGAGLAYLRDAVLTKYSAVVLSKALRGVTVAVRGPKPLAILHELGVQPQVRLPEPNTWREMLSVMEGRPERRMHVPPSVQRRDRVRPSAGVACAVAAARGVPDEAFALQRHARHRRAVTWLVTCVCARGYSRRAALF